MEEQKITIRKVLDNEFARLGGIIIACWMVVVNIVIPLNTIQVVMTQIQATQQDIARFQAKQLVLNDAFNSRLSVLESKVKK